MIGEKGELVMTKLVYPEGEEDQFKKVINLLKTNKMLEHYDLMRQK